MPKRRSCRFVVLVGLVCFGPPALADGPLRTAGDRPVDIIHLSLELSVDLPGEHVAGSATIDLTALRDVTSIRFDAVDFEVTRVTFARGEGRPVPVKFINDGKSIKVLLGDVVLAEGHSGTVKIDYSISHPTAGLHFFKPTEANPDVALQVWSQGESITNRFWVPCFDHPNEMQTTEMRITAAAGNEVISNGRLVSKKSNPDGTTTFHWLQDKPHVSYLMTLVVGKFHVAKETWRGKDVLYYVPPDKKDDVQRTFKNTVAMLEFFSNITGVEYPWDKYAQICAEQFGGGMENTSATTLGTWTLRDERASLDSSADSLIAHELAHQWFGDLVTCKDWAHLWLNEGFASFMDPVWFEHHLGKDEYDYKIYRAMKRAISGGKDRPIVDRRYEHPRNMFDSRAYPKGASVLHMLRRRVGNDKFWASVQKYLETYAHQSVETAVFRRTFESVTGRSLERFFYDWTERPGAPEFSVSFDWDDADSLAEVVIEQTQEADAFHVPIEIEFRFEQGDPIFLSREMTTKNMRVLYPLPSYPTMVLFDPHDAVLKEIEEDKGRDLWENQLTNAPNITSRIRAALNLGEKGGDKDIETLRQALMSEPFWGVCVEIAKAIGEAGGDAARDALLEGLRLEHPKVRRACADKLGEFHKDDKVIAALYELIQKGDPSYSVEASAIRSYGKLQPDGAVDFLASLLNRDSHRDQIRSAALRALGELDDPAGLDTLLDWTTQGSMIFTRSAALGALGDLAQNADLEDEARSRIVDLAAERLKVESRWAQRACIKTLEKLGETSRTALPAMRSVAANDPEVRTRDAVKKAIKSITQASPPDVQVDDLRDELDSLREVNDDLLRRLEKLEARLPTTDEGEGD